MAGASPPPSYQPSPCSAARAPYTNVYIVVMDIASLIRKARQDADITQVALAARAGTAQPAIAAYESGARTPNLATLERLLRACDQDLDLVIRPRVRRGAPSLAELSANIAEDVAKGRDDDAVRLLFGFADDFRGSSRPGRLSLLVNEPDATGDRRFDAALAGLAEFFAIEAALPAPAWVNAPERFVEPWWFISSRPAFDAYTLANTPAAFARHGVFVAREVFDRA